MKNKLALQKLVRGLFSATLMLGAVESVGAYTLVDLNANPDNWQTVASRVVVSREIPPSPADTPTPSMWTCLPGDASACADAHTGPDNASFILKNNNFFIPAGANVGGAFKIIADDYLEVYINNVFAFSAMLDNNLSSPISFVVNGFDLELKSGNLISQGSFKDVFQTGQNGMFIQAYDGDFGDRGPGSGCILHPIPGTQSDEWCERNRARSYVYVDGAIVVAPEPTTLALFMTGIFVLGSCRKAQARRS